LASERRNAIIPAGLEWFIPRCKSKILTNWTIFFTGFGGGQSLTSPSLTNPLVKSGGYKNVRIFTEMVLTGGKVWDYKPTH
jgi:hypothetical protein